jgi:hypothetical protein
VEDVKAVLEEASSSNRQAAREARAFRRGLNQQPTYTRRTKNDKESLARMEDDGVGYSTSGLVAQVLHIADAPSRLIYSRPSSTQAVGSHVLRVDLRLSCIKFFVIPEALLFAQGGYDLYP